MIAPSTLTNWHLNGILHARLYGVDVKYLGLGKLTDIYIPGSDPVSKDPDFGWIPVPNYAGDPGDAQFLRYELAPNYNFTIEPHEGQISVTMEVKNRDAGQPITATNAIEITEARATAVAVYTMLEVI
jgi:hypothetical protein